MKNLILRSVAGIVYIAIIVAALTLPSIWFMLLLVLFATFGITEFNTVTAKYASSDKLTRGWDRLTAAVAVAMSCLAADHMNLAGSPLPVMTFYLPVVFCLLVRGIIQLYMPRQNAILSIAASSASLLYIAAPLSLLPYIYFCYGSPMLILSMFIMIWMSDTGAYVVGSLIGRRKLFERLSPKKSWEGFFGGLLFTLLAAFVIHTLAPAWTGGLNVWQTIGLGGVVCVFGTWGDLFESMLKRTSGIKDSGHIIPGHGGILDRIDSLLFVIPATLIYLMVF